MKGCIQGLCPCHKPQPKDWADLTPDEKMEIGLGAGKEANDAQKAMMDTQPSVGNNCPICLRKDEHSHPLPSKEERAKQIEKLVQIVKENNALTQPSAAWRDRFYQEWAKVAQHPSANGMVNWIAKELSRAREEARYEIEAFVKDEKDPEIILDFIRSRTTK